MSASKKSKRKKSVDEKAQRINKEVREFYAKEPKDSIGVQVAKQCETLREFLCNPRSFIEIYDDIVSDPTIRTIENYGLLLQYKGELSSDEAMKFVFTLISYHTIKTWRLKAFCYVISAPLLDRVLSDSGEIEYNVSVKDFRLSFNSFFVDLGLINDSNQHIGVFMNQNSSGSKIDLVLVNGEYMCCFVFSEDSIVKMPKNLEDRNLNNPQYVEYLLIAMLRIVSEEQTVPKEIVDEGKYSREHIEWRSYYLLPGQKYNDFMIPIWNREAKGGVFYSSKSL